MAQYGGEGFDPRRYLRVAWGAKWVLLAGVVLIPAAMFAVSSALPKTYEASATLHVEEATVSSRLASAGITVSTSDAAETARLIETTLVAERAARELGEDTSSARSLLSQIEVELDEESAETEFLTIVARAGSAARSAEIANAFADAVSATRSNQAIETIDETIEILTADARAVERGDKATRQALAEQLQELRALRASQRSGGTQVIEPAVAPSDPASPTPVRNAALGLVLALLLAGGLVPLLDRMDRRLRDPEELEQIVEAPLLAAIPTGAFPWRLPTPDVREAFQTLRAGLIHFHGDTPLRSVIVASPTQGDGRTTVSTNLALALARAGRDVVLVDADMRRPRVASELGAEVRIGLDAVLGEGRPPHEALVDVEAEGGRLRILANGSPVLDPSTLLDSATMRSVLDELSTSADVVLIDTPPLLSVSDAIPLFEQASGALLVARVDHTDRDDLIRARHMISAAGGTVLGAVATGTRSGHTYYGDAYLDHGSTELGAAGHRAEAGDATAAGDGRGTLAGRGHGAPTGGPARAPSPRARGSG